MGKQRLLLVEDDYDVAEMLLMYFESLNYDVIHADNGTDGVEIARTKFPNLILLDVMLPDMDGYDVCVRLRHTAMTKFIPILFLTQRDERASKVRGLELGADDYITKPFDIDELRLRVQGAIRRATRENLHEPRTGLPTGPLIEEELARKLAYADKLPFIQLTYKVDGFYAYSDVYGFVASNEVITHAGNVVRRMVSDHGTENDFVGIVDDEIIVLTYAAEVDTLDSIIRKQFDEDAHTFYSFVDVERGGLVMNEGQTDEYTVPIMTLKSTRRTPVNIED